MSCSFSFYKCNIRRFLLDLWIWMSEAFTERRVVGIGKFIFTVIVEGPRRPPFSAPFHRGKKVRPRPHYCPLPGPPSLHYYHYYPHWRLSPSHPRSLSSSHSHSSVTSLRLWVHWRDLRGTRLYPLHRGKRLRGCEFPRRTKFEEHNSRSKNVRREVSDQRFR